MEAEHLFNEHLRKGLDDLQEALEEIQDTYSSPISCAAATSDHEDDNSDAGEEGSENRILIDTRAADVLDRETAFLQPNAELEGITSIRRRSKSLPDPPSAGIFLEPTRYHPVKFPGESQILSAQEDPYEAEQQVLMPTEERLELIDESCPDCTGHDRIAGAYFNDDPLSPWSTSFGSGAATPAILGEAYLVDIHQPSEPPTPAQTPPPRRIARPQNKSFYNLHVTNCQTAVDTQDALRSLLGTYFVSEGAGHQQATFPFPRGLDDIWQPVFKKTGPDSSGICKRNVDLILAIGAQEGVDDEFVRALSGSLEKLGTKPDGITRGGRLNLGYLVVNAMRTLSTQPSSDHALDGPFPDPYPLATLVIPILETYMSFHSKIQFLLLEYPPEHLGTILAMQQLIGGDLLKVAGILDDSAGELRPGPSGVEEEKRHAAATASGARLLDSGAPPRTTPSFSKADFLLTSSATESEIATLVSAVWKILVNRSPSYVSDGAPSTSAAARDSPQNPGSGSENGPLARSPPIESGIRYEPLDSAAVMMGSQRPSSTSTSHGVGLPGSPASRPRPRVPRAPSPAKSSRSSTAGTVKKSSQRAKPRSVLGRELDVDGGSAVAPPYPASSSCDSFEDDQDDDEDGRFAAEERKYLPLFMGRRETPKGSSRKALKFLGLSTEE
ncbi:hypothetical protein DL764_001943 [Monosporascus ibericus]|uniref:Uncharacterized protein n=1 Tax=Monosporascus ibericus TaxID=155417 RepID=A0A4Q4TPY6_9PEZI|nr:hypothetical protein DL764_001943 [Monosporascus ibericus]